MTKFLVKISEDLISKSGTAYKLGSVEDEASKIYGVLCFPKFSQYDQFKEGNFIEAILTPTKDGDKYFVNDEKKLQPPAFVAQRRAGIAQAQEVKAQNIEKSQDRKASDVRVSATARDATIILSTFYKDLQEDEIKDKWNYWRKWLWFQWDKHNEYPPFE